MSTTVEQKKNFCPYCSRDQLSSTGEPLHTMECKANPFQRGCYSCSFCSGTGNCSLGLIGIDFVKKTKAGRKCGKWKRKERPKTFP